MSKMPNLPNHLRPTRRRRLLSCRPWVAFHAHPPHHRRQRDTARQPAIRCIRAHGVEIRCETATNRPVDCATKPVKSATRATADRALVLHSRRRAMCGRRMGRERHDERRARPTMAPADVTARRVSAAPPVVSEASAPRYARVSSGSGRPVARNASIARRAGVIGGKKARISEAIVQLPQIGSAGQDVVARIERVAAQTVAKLQVGPGLGHQLHQAPWRPWATRRVRRRDFRHALHRGSRTPECRTGALLQRSTRRTGRRLRMRRAHLPRRCQRQQHVRRAPTAARSRGRGGQRSDASEIVFARHASKQETTGKEDEFGPRDTGPAVRCSQIGCIVSSCC